MGIGDREQVVPLALQPGGGGAGVALGTVTVPTRVVGDPLEAAGVARLHVPTKLLGAAGSECAHHPGLVATEATVLLPVGSEEAAQDLGDLEAAAAHLPRGRGAVRA
jgi:hypothetical protein